MGVARRLPGTRRVQLCTCRFPQLVSRPRIAIVQYREMYERSINDPDGFWGDIASEFHWEKKASHPRAAREGACWMLPRACPVHAPAPLPGPCQSAFMHALLELRGSTRGVCACGGGGGA